MRVSALVMTSLVGLFFCRCLELGNSRAKRFIIFDGSGVVKFVAGAAYPIRLVDKQRSLSYFYNFQAQYTPPSRPLYWWSLFNTSTFAARESSMLMPSNWDASRAWLYGAIEALLSRAGVHRSECLPRAICEVSRLPFSPTSLYSELLNALLIPRLANVPAKYLDSRDAGQRDAADCAQIYARCDHRAWGWFERISKII